MATIDIYDKGQVDTLLSAKADTTDLPSAAELVPDYSGASADDVLTIENGAPVWKAASGGGVTRLTFTTVSSAYQWLLNSANPGDIIIFSGVYTEANNARPYSGIFRRTTTSIGWSIDAILGYYQNYPLKWVHLSETKVYLHYRTSYTASSDDTVNVTPSADFTMIAIHFD